MVTTYFHGIESNRNVHKNFVWIKRLLLTELQVAVNMEACVCMYLTVFWQNNECFQNTVLKYDNRKIMLFGLDGYGLCFMGAFRNSIQFRSVNLRSK